MIMNINIKKIIGCLIISGGYFTHSLSTTIIKPMQKQHLMFFPARFQQPLPREMYANFVSKLSENYEVHVANTDLNKNRALINNILSKSKQDNISLISHSSGVVDLWNTYSSTTTLGNVDKIILIEPLDLQKGILPISSTTNALLEQITAKMENLEISEINNKIEEIVETNYVELLKSSILSRFSRTNKKNKQRESEYGEEIVNTENSKRGKMLVVKHKQSAKWRFIPTVPPLSLLDSDLMSFQKTMAIDEVVIDGFSHFDILDRPWANLMNRASLANNKRQEELDEYLNVIDDIVFDMMN